MQLLCRLEATLSTLILFFSHLLLLYIKPTWQDPNHKTTHTPSTVTVSWFQSTQTVWFRGSVNGRLWRLILWGYLYSGKFCSLAALSGSCHWNTNEVCVYPELRPYSVARWSHICSKGIQAKWNRCHATVLNLFLHGYPWHLTIPKTPFRPIYCRQYRLVQIWEICLTEHGYKTIS